MPRQEVTLSPSPPGAGRFRDYMYPDLASYQNNDNATSRINSAVGTVGQLTTTLFAYGGGAGNRANVRSQVPCIDFACSAVAGNGNGIGFTGSKLLFPTSTAAGGNFVNGLANDMQCWRVVIVGGLAAIPANEVDIGFGCVTLGNISLLPQIIANAIDGFGFGFQADGSVRFFSNLGGVLTQQTVTPTAAQGFLYTAAHAYEVRIAGATATADATLAAYVDGSQVALPASLSTWGAGTQLPQQTSASVADAGFICALGIKSTGVASAFFVNQARVICAPTPDALL